MPIVVRHTPVGLLTRLAVESGQARRRDIQAQRDIQLQQTAWAAEERGADVAARRAEQQQAQEFRQVGQQQAQMAAQRQTEAAITMRREEQQQAQTFALQRIGAAQIARERVVTQAEQREREQLQQTVLQAKESGIYDSKQIQRAQIFADLGDKIGMRGVLRTILQPTKPTARQKLLQQQTTVIGELTQQDLDKIDRQIQKRQTDIDGIDDAWSKEYAPAVWAALQEMDPKSMPKNVRGSIKKRQGLVAEQQVLRAQRQGVEQQAEQVTRQLQQGFTIPEQMTRKATQKAKQRQMKIDAVKRIEKRNQRRIERQIAAKERRAKIDPDANPTMEATRVKRIENEIKVLEKELQASFNREDAALGGLSIGQRMTPSERKNTLSALMAEAKGDPIEVQRLAAERGLK